MNHYLIFNWGLMPENKYDVNNCGPLSTDMIGMNYEYPDGDYDTRAKIWKEHVEYTKGLLYFLSHDDRLPEALRKRVSDFGWAKDEFVDNDNFPTQLYVREARRMVGEYVMTQKNCQGEETVGDAIGMAAYGMDSHNCQRIVTNGMVKMKEMCNIMVSLLIRFLIGASLLNMMSVRICWCLFVYHLPI